MTATPYVTPPTVVAQIAALPELSWRDLVALWHQLFGKAPTVSNRRFVERRIAYRLQENAYREVNPALLERNAQRIDALIRTGRPTPPPARPVPGTVLQREYDGVVHQVTALPDGQFAYQGQPYASLSRIAREITGTRWSGPAFFGLRERPLRARRGAGR